MEEVGPKILFLLLRICPLLLVSSPIIGTLLLAVSGLALLGLSLLFLGLSPRSPPPFVLFSPSLFACFLSLLFRLFSALPGFLSSLVFVIGLLSSFGLGLTLSLVLLPLLMSLIGSSGVIVGRVVSAAVC